MTIPAWAVRALDSRKPLPPMFPKSAGPDPERLRQWSIFNERFRSRWRELDADAWAVALYPESPDLVRTRILAFAVDCAWELGKGKDPRAVVEATKRLDELNHEICITAERLAGLLLKREDILAAHPLIENEHSGPDPIYLWEALELALATPDLLPWASVASAELAPFLRIAAEQSRPGPEWADLLHQLSSRDYRRALPYEAADIAVVASGTNQTAWSPWLLRLIATLNEAKAVDETSLLQCLTNKQLASLAAVALDTPAGVINDSQIRMLKRRFLKRNIPAND